MINGILMGDDMELGRMDRASVVASFLGLPPGQYELKVDNSSGDESITLTGRNECGEIEFAIRVSAQRVSKIWSYQPSRLLEEREQQIDSCRLAQELLGVAIDPESDCAKVAATVQECRAEEPDMNVSARLATALRIYTNHRLNEEDRQWVSDFRTAFEATGE